MRVRFVFAMLALGLCWSLPSRAEAGSSSRPRPYQRLIEDVAGRYGLDPDLFSALVDVESARRSGAVSSKGATGLAQLMPSTAERFGVQDRENPEENLHGAARYLRWLLDRFHGRVDLALAAYNAGEANVDRYKSVPPFPETMTFVQKVMKRAGLQPPGETGLDRTTAAPVRLLRRKGGGWLMTNTDRPGIP